MISMALGGTVAVLQNLWQSFEGYSTGIVSALVILVIGWAIGRVIGRVVREILERVQVNKYVQKEGHLNFEVSSIFDTVVRWIIYIVFISQATKALGVPILTEFLFGSVLPAIGGVVGAGIVVLVAYMIGVYFKERIIQTEEREETAYADISGKIVFWLANFFGVALALDIFFKYVLRTGTRLVPNLLMIIVGGVSLGIAIATGLGLKDVVGEMAEDYAEEFKEKRK